MGLKPLYSGSAGKDWRENRLLVEVNHFITVRNRSTSLEGQELPGRRLETLGCYEPHRLRPSFPTGVPTSQQLQTPNSPTLQKASTPASLSFTTASFARVRERKKEISPSVNNIGKPTHWDVALPYA
jgi:hypothetical protein